MQLGKVTKISDFPNTAIKSTSSSAKHLATGTDSVKVSSRQAARRGKSLVGALVEYSDNPLLAIEIPDSPQKIIFSKQCDICSKVFPF